MTVDMLSATFWPELPPPAAPPGPGVGAEAGPAAPEAAADAADRAEGFWAAVLRHLWHPAERAALP